MASISFEGLCAFADRNVNDMIVFLPEGSAMVHAATLAIDVADLDLSHAQLSPDAVIVTAGKQVAVWRLNGSAPRVLTAVPAAGTASKQTYRKALPDLKAAHKTTQGLTSVLPARAGQITVSGGAWLTGAPNDIDLVSTKGTAVQSGPFDEVERWECDGAVVVSDGKDQIVLQNPNAELTVSSTATDGTMWSMSALDHFVNYYDILHPTIPTSARLQLQTHKPPAGNPHSLRAPFGINCVGGTIVP